MKEVKSSLFSAADAQYVVLTTRHHDGFSLFDSNASNLTSVKTAAGRDVIAEYTWACRAAGLKVGLYYSLSDWWFHMFEPRWPGTTECIRNFPHKFTSAWMVKSGRRLRVSQQASTVTLAGLPDRPESKLMDVIKLEVAR